MSTVVKDLGAVSAYAYAVEKGYTGTEAEFAELMADYAEVEQRAEDAADSALESKTAAQTAATTATNKATEATTAATTATTKAGEASTSASTATSAKDTAVSASQTATTKAGEATTAAATATSAATTATTAKDDAVSAKTAAQTAQTGAETAAASVAGSAAQIQTNAEDISQLKSDFADMQSDGVVPSAEQILTDKGVTDSAPYHYRKTGGDGADRLYDQIVGGTVCFNQLVQNIHATVTKNGVTATNNGDGSMTLSGTATAATAIELTVSFSWVKNHVYYLGKPLQFDLYNGYVAEGKNIVKTTDDITSYVYALIPNGVTLNEKIYPQGIDLTAMFGPTIADYIYQLEQTTARAGVAFFKSLFPNDYYPYNAGELISVSGLSEHKMVGFNQWDEEWEVGGIRTADGITVPSNAVRSTNYNAIIGGATYYTESPSDMSVYMYFYDADYGYISYTQTLNNTFVAPLNAKYFKIQVTGAYGTTYKHDICINLSDPTKNGQYKPYESHSYPLDSSLTLRGIPKLDSNNKLYFDGDVYEYTGEVTRNTILRAYQNGDESLANAITDGTNTVVYSANASTEQATPYQHLQQCDPNGTEEYVSTCIVPIGHNSFYPENLRAKVEQLPWNFANLIAPTESAFTATRNYTTGALFIVQNVLYKATSNIANGGTITPNTNCTATTLAEIISALA